MLDRSDIFMINDLGGKQIPRSFSDKKDFVKVTYRKNVKEGDFIDIDIIYIENGNFVKVKQQCKVILPLVKGPKGIIRKYVRRTGQCKTQGYRNTFTLIQVLGLQDLNKSNVIGG